MEAFDRGCGVVGEEVLVVELGSVRMVKPGMVGRRVMVRNIVFVLGGCSLLVGFCVRVSDR